MQFSTEAMTNHSENRDKGSDQGHGLEMPVVPVPGGKVLAPGSGAFDLSRLIFINHCSSAPIALKYDRRFGKGQNC